MALLGERGAESVLKFQVSSIRCASRFLRAARAGAPHRRPADSGCRPGGPPPRDLRGVRPRGGKLDTAGRGPTLKGVSPMSVTMRQMLEAGVHFGHQTRYWNPKMADVHLRPAQQDPHRQSRKDDGDVPGGDEVRPPAGGATTARSCSSAPSARRATSSPRKRSAPACPTSTTAGWAACSPTSRRSRASIKRLKDLEAMATTARSSG